MAADCDRGRQKSVLLFSARIQEDQTGQPALVTAAQPLREFMAEGAGFDLALPWDQGRTLLGTSIHTPADRFQHSGPVAELAKLSELLQDSLLISFDAGATHNIYLQPLYTAYNSEPPAFSCLSIRDLAQRLLDPEPEACRSLEALSAFCGLATPEQENPRAAVLTLARLLDEVLRPKLAERQLTTWEQITAFAASPWFPSRFAFGK